MQQAHRELKKAERDELAGIVALSTQIGRAVLFVAAIVIMAGLFRLAQTFFPIEAPAWLVPTALVAYLLYRRAGRWTGGPNLRRRIREDLEANEVRELIVRPAEVTEFEEEEDEGPSYVIRTDDGQWVLLSGQEMAHRKLDGFPWSEFSVIEAPRSGYFFGIGKRGDSIPVNKTLPQLPYELARDLGAFERTMVILEENQRVMLDPLLQDVSQEAVARQDGLQQE